MSDLIEKYHERLAWCFGPYPTEDYQAVMTEFAAELLDANDDEDQRDRLTHLQMQYNSR